MNRKPRPVQKDEDTNSTSDREINEDHATPAENEIGKSINSAEVDLVVVHQPEGEKRLYKKDETDEQDSDGSASAFEGK